MGIEIEASTPRASDRVRVAYTHTEREAQHTQREGERHSAERGTARTHTERERGIAHTQREAHTEVYSNDEYHARTLDA